MTTVTRGRRIYPARRAVEHAVIITGIRPLRLFPVLWPLWQVETTANVHEEQAYEVLDHFLARAVLHAGLFRVDDLARFFGVPVALVQRCLAFLSTIGHAQVEAGVVRLTDLGRHSAQTGVRYVAKESRQDVLVERFTAQPLPRRYYEGSAPVFPTPEVPEDRQSDRSRFTPLFAPTPFRTEIVEQLTQRTDRAALNLPPQLRNLRVIQERNAFLPAYLIETADSGLLVYTAVAAERDAFFESVARQVPAIGHMVRAEDTADPREVWTAWLAEGKAGRGTLRQLPNGVWRVVLRPDAFGDGAKLPLSRVGSFELRKRLFLQLWCEDVELRHRAVLERALAMTHAADITSKSDLQARAATLARQLEVAAPTLADLRSYGDEHRMYARVARLDALE